MQFDYNQLNQGGQLDKMLNALPYPMDKDELVMEAQQAGANQQMVAAMQQMLPDRTFKSADEVKNAMRNKVKERY